MPNPYHAKEFALIDDGRIVAARDDSGHAWGWRTATGEPCPLEIEATLKNANWQNIAFYQEQFLFGKAAEKFLDDAGLRSLIKRSSPEGKIDNFQVIKTNDKELDLTDMSALQCGNPDVAFAKHGDRIAFAPTARDASHFFLNSAVVAPSSPKVKWTHFCRDFMYSNIWMECGQIVACTDPSNCAVWDPNTAKIVKHRPHEPDHSIVPPNASTDGKYLRVDHDERLFSVVNAKTGRHLMSFKNNFWFSNDSRHVWVAEDWQPQSITESSNGQATLDGDRSFHLEAELRRQTRRISNRRISRRQIPPFERRGKAGADRGRLQVPTFRPRGCEEIARKISSRPGQRLPLTAHVGRRAVLKF
jgi:hypothetical protein